MGRTSHYRSGPGFERGGAPPVLAHAVPARPSKAPTAPSRLDETRARLAAKMPAPASYRACRQIPGLRSKLALVSDLCFALPPSLGEQNVKTLAREFALILYEAGFSTVIPVNSYETMERSLLSGEIHAAWGPPMVCARVQAAGGAVALRAIRNGSSVYRSALLCRSHDDLRLEELGRRGLRRLRAVWVDPQSMGGYIMPRHHLRSHGIDLEQAFEEETILGSYEACFSSLMSCESDVTASYVNGRGVGYVELCGHDAHHLRVFAYSDEFSNDGVVVSPKANGTSEVNDRLAKLLENPAHKEIFCAALNVDDVETPPVDAYSPLLALQE